MAHIPAVVNGEQHACEQFEYARVLADDDGLALLLRCTTCGAESWHRKNIGAGISEIVVTGRNTITITAGQHAAHTADAHASGDCT